MKRYCATCLWWPTDDRFKVCRNPDARAAVPNHLEYWCAKWEPRDRSLVRCETCEWYEAGRCLQHLTRGPVGTARGLIGSIVHRRFHCSHWRLREERDDA